MNWPNPPQRLKPCPFEEPSCPLGSTRCGGTVNSLGAALKVVGVDIQTSCSWSMIFGMTLSRRFRKLGQQVEDAVNPTSRTTVLLRNIGLLSAGVTVVAIGVMVGRELRNRYKFNRRTPYDLYAHSGDEQQQVEEMEFGLGT